MSDPTPKEIRDAYQDYRDAWREIRDAATEDMRAISPEGPWSDEDRDARKGSGRPCIHLDQLNQFLAQVNGNVRKSKRAIKAIPKGNGANDQDAQKRSAAIMGIEERSQAQPIYLNAFQSMIERSYGFAVIRTEYRDGSSFDMEILIKPVMNPDTVLLSPYFKQPDASDIPDAFFLDLIPKADFKKKYPKRARDRLRRPGLERFNHHRLDQRQIPADRASTGRCRARSKRCCWSKQRKGPIIFKEDEWKEMPSSAARSGEVKRDRKVEIPEVFQYMTNGLEILDKVPWDGSRIPIISCLGPERWTTEGGKPKRQLLSMVRFARDPQMLLDYLASGECEEAGQIPKSPFVGAVGQFETDKVAWSEVTKVPHAFLQYDLVLDSGGQPAPPPARPAWTPNFQESGSGEGLGHPCRCRPRWASRPCPMPRSGATRNLASRLRSIDDHDVARQLPLCRPLRNRLPAQHGLADQRVDHARARHPARHADLAARRQTLDHAIVGNTSHPIGDHGAYEVQGLDHGHLHTGKGEFDVTISTGPS